MFIIIFKYNVLKNLKYYYIIIYYILYIKKIKYTIKKQLLMI